MTSNSKTFLWTFFAVVAGIYIYARYKMVQKTIHGEVTIGEITIKQKAADAYYGPAIDPLTGVYLPPGAQPGTVSAATPDEYNTAPLDTYA